MFNLGKLLKVIDPDPVLIDQSNCLRVRHARSACRACSDICPTEAIGYAWQRLSVDPSPCTRCGLCMGACPTVALKVRSFDESSLDGAFRLRCERAPGDGVVVPCLGALSCDQLVDLGSRQPDIVLSAGDCGACTLSLGGAKARENLTAAMETLRALGVEQLPAWVNATDGLQPDAQRPISRRELFSLWSQNAFQTGRSLLTDRPVNPVKLPVKVPARRLRWLKRFAVPTHDHRMIWPTRSVSADCTGCNICVAFCPTGALSSQPDPEKWSLSFQAAACVDCRTCIDLCPRRAITPGESPMVREVVGGCRHTLIAVAVPDSAKSGAGRPTIGMQDLGKLQKWNTSPLHAGSKPPTHGQGGLCLQSRSDPGPGAVR